jgi:hypothetical protein
MAPLRPSRLAIAAINVKEASWKTHEILTAWGHANGLL